MSLLAQIRKTYQAGCIAPPDAFACEGDAQSVFRTESVMLEDLGRQLVERAGEHIPGELMTAASNWRAMSVSQQLALLRRFCRWIAREHVRILPARSIEETLEALGRPYDERELFPAFWGRNGVTPNCLGLLMLAAHFAAHTGSPFRVLNVIKMSGVVQADLLGRLYGSAKADLEQRYLVLDDEILAKMEDRIARGRYSGLGVSSFHHALAIQLADGRWYCLDPNTETHGIAPDSWQLHGEDGCGTGSAWLTGSDHEFRVFADKQLRLLQEAICFSRALEPVLSELMDDWIGTGPHRPGRLDPLLKLLAILKDREEWSFLQRILPSNRRLAILVKRLRKERTDPFVRLLLCLFGGANPPDADDLIAFADEFRESLDRREESLRCLLSRFHFWSISRYFRRIKRPNPALLHPWVEVNAEPYRAIALFTVNSVRHARGWRASARCLQHSSSQLMAREVLNTGRLASEARSSIVVSLQQAPALHPLVQHTLDREVQHGRT